MLTIIFDEVCVISDCFGRKKGLRFGVFRGAAKMRRRQVNTDFFVCHGELFCGSFAGNFGGIFFCHHLIVVDV